MPVEEQAPVSGPAEAPDVLDWERTYAVWMHLLLLSAHLGVPFVPTLVMWLVKRDQSPYIDDHGREAVNFQISLFLIGVVFGVMGFMTCGVTWYVGMPLLYILGLVGMIMAAVAAHHGRYFRYPMCIRLIH